MGRSRWTPTGPVLARIPKELTEYMPQDIYEWDNAANNRWIIEGKGSGI